MQNVDELSTVNRI